MNIETTAEPIREGLPSLPKGKMLSGMDMESLHVLYTAGQMQDYARAALAARAAAPVSGQGVSLGDDAGIAIFYPNFGGNTYPTHTVIQAGEAANAYIDSRPRSEDSRAKVLEEAAQACDSRAENFQTSMTNAIHGSTAELARALRNEASSCALAIRALASTITTESK